MRVLFSLALPAASGWMGFELLRFILWKEMSVLESVGAAFPLGAMISAFAGLCLNTVLPVGFLHWLAQVIGAVSVAVSLNKRNAKKGRGWRWTRSAPEPSLAALFTFLLGCVFLTNRTIFPEKDEILKTGENDMMMEFSLVNSFLRGVNHRRSFLTRFRIPLDYKIRTFMEMVVPFYLAVMKCGFANMKMVLRTMNNCLFGSACILVYAITKKVTGNVFLSVLSVPSLFLVGGFGFVEYAKSANWNDNVDFVFSLGKAGHVQWGHPLLHCFLTSRIMAMSLVNTLLVILFLEHGKDVLAGLICIAQVFVRPHSALALSVAFMVYRMRLSKWKTVFGLFTLLLALFNIPVVKFHNPVWNKGITGESLVPFLSFPCHVYGTLFFALVFLLRPQVVKFLVSPVLLFYLLCVIQLQPDPRFNFTTAQTVVTPLIVVGAMSGLSWFMSLWKNEVTQGIVAGLTFFFIGVSWLSSLAGLSNTIFSTVVISGEETNDISKWVTRNTKVDSVFYAPNSILWNPAVTRAGRLSYVAQQNTLHDFLVNSTLEEQAIETFKNTHARFAGPDYFLLPNEDSVQQHLEVMDLVFSTLSYSLYTWKKNNVRN